MKLWSGGRGTERRRDLFLYREIKANYFREMHRRSWGPPSWQLYQRPQFPRLINHHSKHINSMWYSASILQPWHFHLLKSFDILKDALDFKASPTSAGLAIIILENCKEGKTQAKWTWGCKECVSTYTILREWWKYNHLLQEEKLPQTAKPKVREIISAPHKEWHLAFKERALPDSE